MSENIPDLNLFMMCTSLKENALREVPPGFSVRSCQEHELSLWKQLHIDEAAQSDDYNQILTEYYNQVYAPQKLQFFQACRFICNKERVPVGTCFIWKAYGCLTTIHWLKIARQYENRGLGRALLSVVLKEVGRHDYPIYLHTHPSSYRAIKLYSDLGFALITDDIAGIRTNDIEASLPILKEYMPLKDYQNLRTTQADSHFLKIVSEQRFEEF